jgi:hypothetical protein
MVATAIREPDLLELLAGSDYHHTVRSGIGAILAQF